ncbi:hypothetical protein UB46_16500 [Burkholderiaceae bacterium 16]|nr:hypothetical protein UB46_16500 [Burkholderiaceae bacterium 16]
MSLLAELKEATTIHDIASLLGFKTAALSYILYVKSDASKYKTFDIPKRSGGVRQISAPYSDLKLLQRRLADLLQNCADEITKNQGRGDEGKNPDRISHGFRRRRSIITNAKQHCKRRHVFNIDIENFFGSINFGRVRGFFIKDNNFDLNPKIATILAQIACTNGSIPQGSPCSPVISNLIGHILDTHLVRLAKRAGCTYSRYADDLTFSTSLRDFPDTIATRCPVNEHDWQPSHELERIITQCGFSLNNSKTRMQYQEARQEVTGLVVNKKVNVRSAYRRTVRAMVHQLFTTGKFHIPGTPETQGSLNQLHGMLGFVDGIDLYNRSLRAKNSGSLGDKEKMYRQFLLFKEFYSADVPVLLCEGKTDNVYITHAIRSLADKYPKLATKKTDGSVTIDFRRFRFTGTSTGRILRLQGGTPDLKAFAELYREESVRFKAPGMKHPVILLIDNDDGARRIYGFIQGITGKRPDGSESFVHVFKNFYVCATPLLAGAKESKIEDFFDPKTLDTKIGAKTFNSKNEIDTAMHYGKAVFAYKVVEAHADKIDFSAFAAIFDNLVKILDYHAAKFVTETA